MFRETSVVNLVEHYFIDDEYWRLAHVFPLAPIRDEAHLEHALSIEATV